MNNTGFNKSKIYFAFAEKTNQTFNHDSKMPKEVIIEDKTAVEQMRLIQQLEEEDRQTIFA